MLGCNPVLTLDIIFEGTVKIEIYKRDNLPEAIVSGHKKILNDYFEKRYLC